MNYGLNATTNVLCTVYIYSHIYDGSIEKKEREEKEKRPMYEEEKKEGESFFPITVEKWKQKTTTTKRKKIRAARHFICFFCLFQ